MKRKGVKPETVFFKDGALGHWLGNKDAKKVVIYFPGMFSMYVLNIHARIAVVPPFISLSAYSPEGTVTSF
jgi:hypothetical protein